MNLGFYFIKDEFFKKYDTEHKLMQNKEIDEKGNKHSRPCFFVFNDKIENEILWCVPLSSQLRKYSNIVKERKKKAYEKGNKKANCEGIRFGNVLGKSQVLLVQNMFPVSAKYIDDSYIDKTTGKAVTMSEKSIEDLRRCAKHVVGAVLSGRNKNAVFADVADIRNQLLEELKKDKRLQTEKQKTRLFVDMDGTLARFHDEVKYLERMYEKDFFNCLKPFDEALAAVKALVEENNNVEVFILSAAIDGEPPYCRSEKNKWLDKFLPEIDREHRIFTKVGESKAKYIPNGITKNDFLWDDYNIGLEQWENDGGRSIKCRNNINHKGIYGSLWQGSIVYNENKAESIKKELLNYIHTENRLENNDDILFEKDNIITTVMEKKKDMKLEKTDFKQAKKAEMTDILQRLETGVKDIYESEKYKNYLRFMGKFNNYSYNNLMLLMLQCQERGITTPEMFASFSTWRKVGVTVNKGEKAFSVLAPVFNKKKLIKATDDKLTPNDESTQLIPDSETETIVGFKVVNHTFEVSQTNGKEKLPTLCNELTGDVEQKEAILSALQNITGISFEYKNITNGAKGYFSKDRIVINENMSDLQTIKTAIHETAHAILHNDKVKNVSELTRQEKEIQAESVAFTVSSAIGLDTSDYSFEYLAGWSKDKDVKILKANLEVVRKTSQEMLEEINKELKLTATNEDLRDIQLQAKTNKNIL